MRCKIKVKKEIGVFPKYRPKVGRVYEADYVPSTRSRVTGNNYSGKSEFCVIDILDKRIVLRRGEFEIVNQ